jgi:4-hydroxy-tetrahydrodipicolinate synthase
MKIHSNTSRREVIRKLALLPFLGNALDVTDYPQDTNRKKHQTTLIPVMITPLRQDSSIDWKTFDRLIEFYDAAGAKGYFANCLSSEMYALTPEERLAVTARVIKRVSRNKPVVSTGSFGDTLHKKAEFIKQVNDLGTDAVILITSHLAEKFESDETLMSNLEKLLQLTGSIPLGTYECPTPYKRVLTPEVVSFMVESKRFSYHKDTSEDLQNIISKLKLATKSKLRLYNAHTASAVPSLQAGGAGLSPISANFYPEILAWVCQYASDPGQKENLNWIQSELAATEPLISKSYPLSSKYFLQKRGVPIELVTRLKRNPLNTELP